MSKEDINIEYTDYDKFLMKERGTGIEYIDSLGEDTIFRVYSFKVEEEISRKVIDYINNNKKGYYLSLPGLDTKYPMQVELEFNKEGHIS